MWLEAQEPEVLLRHGPARSMRLMRGDHETEGNGGLVVILSRDPELTRALPMSLWRLDTSLQVQVVSHAVAVRERSVELEPDTVVLDVQAVDFEEVIEFLLSDAFVGVPLIVLDPEDDASRRHDALEAGAVAYLGATECAPDTVANIVQRAMRARRCGSRGPTARHFEDIVEASSDGIFVLVDGAFHFVNHAFAAALGRPAAELAASGTSLLEFVPEEFKGRVSEDLARVGMSAGARDLIEIVVHDVHGRVACFEVSCRTSVVEGRRALVGVARDVTASQELQLEIERARKRAAQVERLRALGELAAGVAHDFNNSVSTVLGRVETLRKKLERHEAIDDDIAVIESAAKNAAAMIKRVQEFARPAGTDTWQDVNLGALVREAARLVQTQVPPNVKLSLILEPTPVIQGNGHELSEVLQNLLRNAFEAIDTKGEVTVRCFTDDGNAVVVVEDTGMGMSTAVQQRIFEPFFSTKGERGNGLGLSVSHWILRRHDAQVQLTSEPGQGTSFRLTFAPFSPPPRRTKGERGDALTIMVVDDDPTVADVIHDLLTEQGHEVLVVNHPTAAAQLLGQRSADLMITDLDLPGMSGWQLASKVREIQPDILVGLVTGWSLGASEQELRARGVDFLLAKPFSADALARAVAQARRRPV